MVVIQSANLALRFLLELCALAGLGYWGFTLNQNLLIRVVAGLGAPLLAAVVWGAFVAPKATMPAPGPVRLLLQIAVFGSAAVALYAAGRPNLGVALAVAAALNGALMSMWKQ